ncbi:small ribosomal subunit Rsm22 family protein [Devosia nitrariae]|uniref:rRNA methyltransferase n=1 Tax=Devosia nitrariae TaxID=2071872 RepID=A0ABQ5WD35_9HYPH|nr:small ribosomal subunit Rsm22 family protein [Devosia nitrariae]GLQ57716.1 hypothetical protein GCM10010862_49750 [Devosia nitrariae]
MADAFPEELTLALRELATGRSRRTLAARAGHISEQYRDRAPSTWHVAAEEDTLAYALSRMPATYAAVSYALWQVDALVDGFSPRTLLDAGSGPGTASWAACALWTDMAQVTMLDHNDRFLSLARSLAASSSQPALREAGILRGDVTAAEWHAGSHDLVTLAYALTELPDDAVEPTVLRLWNRTEGVLVIVEPGRPHDYRRLMRAREALVRAGARIAAPCPHDESCPLVDPDWCHFAVRLARSRDHQALKGARLGYEDEKFSYLVAVRPHLTVRGGWSRVIKRPAATKFSMDMQLCTQGGLVDRQVLKRDKEQFKRARKLEWGDRTAEPGA